MDLLKVVELGERMERPRTLTICLSSADYLKLADYCKVVNCSCDTFARGIVQSFLNQFGDLMARTAADLAPDQEVSE